ncbi:MAG: cyclic nucleotide-binding domain-containing protein [Pseudomonadota bacterium]
MAKVQIIDRPRRWDEPFAQTRLPVEAINSIMSLPALAALDRREFPDDLQPGDIIANDSRILNFNAGDVIYKAGAYHTSLFLILNGAVRLQIAAPERPAAATPKTPSGESWVRRTFRKGRKRLEKLDWKRNAAPPPEDLLRQNDLFGETEALTRTPRQATAIAAERATVLEIRWPGARELMHWSDAFRQRVEHFYRGRSVEIALRQSALFEGVENDLLRGIAKQCFFESHGGFGWTHLYQRQRIENLQDHHALDHEPVIVEEGQYLEDLFLLRSGFVRLTVHNGQVERTVGFLKAGETFGAAEIGESMRSGGPALASCGLRAVGYADIVRIPAHFIEDSVLLAAADATKGAAPYADRRAYQGRSQLDFVVNNRLINGAKAMFVDTTRCVNCDDCVRACAATHDNIPRFNRQGFAHGKFTIANACMHCADPVCLVDCPTGAITRDAGTGNVLIDEKTCVGCASCESACPYNNIRMIDAQNASGQLLVDKDGTHIRTAVKCDLCTGQSGGPACLRACPHDAIERVDLRELQTLSKWH